MWTTVTALTGACAGAGGAGTEATTDAASTGSPATTGSSPTTSATTTTTMTSTTTMASTTDQGTTSTGTAVTSGGTSTSSDTTGTTGDDNIEFDCEDTTGGGTSGGTTGEEGVCACIVDDPEGNWGTLPSDPLCGEALCPTVEGQPNEPDGFCYFKSLTVVNPEALQCALTALRNRSPGVIRWACGDHNGQYFDDGYILINADGTAIRRHWGDNDLSYDVSAAEHGPMPDACAFEQCLAAGSDGVRFDCMRRFPLGPPIVVCDDAWSVGGI